MLTLDCLTRSIQLRMVDCAPEPIVRATLSRRNLPTYELSAATDPEHPTDGLLLSLAPDDTVPQRGVWQLSLETDCRCFATNVFVDSCQQPALRGQHFPTEPSVPIVTCCIPPLQPDPDTPPMMLGFTAEVTVAGTGVDAPADLLAPAPALTTFRFLVDDGVLDAAIAPLTGYSTWTLLDKGARTVMQGTIAAGVLSTDNVRAITCTTYYLRLDP